MTRVELAENSGAKTSWHDDSVGKEEAGVNH
jgi:hypothetical protein